MITDQRTTIWLTVYVHTPMPYLQNWKGSKYWDHNCDSVDILAPKQKLSFLLETEWISIPFLQWRRVLLIADAVYETASSPGTFWDSISRVLNSWPKLFTKDYEKMEAQLRKSHWGKERLAPSILANQGNNNNNRLQQFSNDCWK